MLFFPCFIGYLKGNFILGLAMQYFGDRRTRQISFVGYQVCILIQDVCKDTRIQVRIFFCGTSRPSFSGPSSAFINLVSRQAFQLKICGEFAHYKIKRCASFSSDSLKTYCADWFPVKAIFQGIYEVLAYSQGTSGLTTCGNPVI